MVTGQMTRQEALDILSKPSLCDEEARKLFVEVAKKLEITEQELDDFMHLPECNVKFKSNKGIYNLGIKVFEKLSTEKRIRK